MSISDPGTGETRAKPDYKYFYFFLFFAENTLRHLRTPRNRLEIASSLSLLVYRCECTLYFSSPQQFFFSPLLRTDSRRNKYKFYIIFLRVFSLPSIFSLQGTYFSLLDPSFFGQDLIYTITRTRLDLCNFYGRSVRISARYKTPNPLCSSSPFYLLTFSLCFVSPKISLVEDSLTHHFTLLRSIFAGLPNQTLITSCEREP